MRVLLSLYKKVVGINGIPLGWLTFSQNGRFRVTSSERLRTSRNEKTFVVRD